MTPTGPNHWQWNTTATSISWNSNSISWTWPSDDTPELPRGAKLEFVRILLSVPDSALAQGEFDPRALADWLTIPGFSFWKVEVVRSYAQGSNLYEYIWRAL